MDLRTVRKEGALAHRTNHAGITASRLDSTCRAAGNSMPKVMLIYRARNGRALRLRFPRLAASFFSPLSLSLSLSLSTENENRPRGAKVSRTSSIVLLLLSFFLSSPSVPFLSFSFSIPFFSSPPLPFSSVYKYYGFDVTSSYLSRCLTISS